MNWISNIIRPKIRSFVQQKEVPDNLWQKCPSCEGMLFHRDLDQNLNVCYHCGHHMKIGIVRRMGLLFDEGKFEELPLPPVPHDPLKFKDRKRYTDRLRDSQSKTGRSEAIIIAKGTIGGNSVVAAGFDFSFMGGSMGSAVGEAIVSAAEAAVRSKSALMVIPASGGARMQEGIISLAQMPRTVIAVNTVKEKGLPYLVLMTDPTTGGVSASFAMVGDIHIAEPGAMVGFAGKRVIEETIREKLPEGFQTAEYLLEHGMIDMVVPRGELAGKISLILDILMCRKRDVGGDNSRKNKNGSGNGNSGGRQKTEEKSARPVARKSGSATSLDSNRKKERSHHSPANTNLSPSEPENRKAGAGK